MPHVTNVTRVNTFPRRTLLKSAGIAAAAAAVSPAVAHAQQRPVLGTVLDYAGGVPSAASVKKAGHIGAVRYVSQRRPGANWMLGKPVTLQETRDFAAHGLATASVYQFGKGDTADWLGGAASAAVHAPQAISLHKAAGGPTGRPIYVAIDDNPTLQQFNSQINPYLSAFGAALKAAGYQLGVYGNYWTIAWCLEDGLGSYFWQHDWGSAGKLHSRANIHQKAGYTATIDNVPVDVNNVYTADWGQWTPGKAAATSPAAPPAGTTAATQSNAEAIAQLVQGSSELSSKVNWDQVLKR